MARVDSVDAPVALCLDVDGTIHRHGSVFVESLALLAYDGGLDLSSADREAIRTILGTVAEYAGGERSRRRWLRVIDVCDAVAATGLGRPVARILGALIRTRARRATASPPGGDASEYRAMQRRVLDAYGQFLDGRPTRSVATAFERVIDRHLRVDDAVRRTLSREGVKTTLVTDIPTHVAAAYAGLLGTAVDTIGTTFAVTAGRFTGEYDFVAKGPAVEQYRAERDPAVLVAAGDSTADLAMASAADIFLAVEGRGAITKTIPEQYRTIGLQDLGPAALDPPPDVVEVPRDVSLSYALDRVLDTVGTAGLTDGHCRL